MTTSLIFHQAALRPVMAKYSVLDSVLELSGAVDEDGTLGPAAGSVSALSQKLSLSLGDVHDMGPAVDRFPPALVNLFRV